MTRLRLRIRILPRRPGGDGDDPHGREGLSLAEMVRDVLGRGGGGAVAVVIRPDRTELVDLRGVVDARVPIPLFLAGLTRSAPEGQRLPWAVGLAGRFLTRSAPGAAPVPVGIVFLEWADCRWWHWRTVLGADGAPIPDGEAVWRAEDGDALPPGVGRWWSLGRRTGNVVQYGRREDPEDPEGSDDTDERDPATIVH